jgi:hypothetical protein
VVLAGGMAYAVWANSFVDKPGKDFAGIAVALGIDVGVLGGLVFLFGVAGLLLGLRRSLRQADRPDVVRV